MTATEIASVDALTADRRPLTANGGDHGLEVATGPPSLLRGSVAAAESVTLRETAAGTEKGIGIGRGMASFVFLLHYKPTIAKTSPFRK